MIAISILPFILLSNFIIFLTCRPAKNAITTHNEKLGLETFCTSCLHATVLCTRAWCHTHSKSKNNSLERITMYQNRHRNAHIISGHTKHTHKTIFKYNMAAILDMVAILKRGPPSPTFSKNRDEQHVIYFTWPN